MKPPNQRTATIGDMLVFASQENGKVTAKKASAIISYCLVNIADLRPLSAIPWQSRKWALPAYREIQRIGICDSLELLAPAKPLAVGAASIPATRIRQLCSLLGLHYNRVNNLTVITRKPLTAIAAPKPVDSEHVDLAMEIDLNAKPTQLCTLPTNQDA